MSRRERWMEATRVARRFLADLVPHRVELLKVGGVSLAVIALELLRPWPMQWIFDRALVPDDVPAAEFSRVVWGGALASVLIVVLRSVGQYQRDLRLAAVEHGFTRGLRYRIFSHLTRLSPLYHAQHKSGDLLVRLMGDAPQVSTMMVRSTSDLATRSLVIVGTLAVMVWMDPWMTLLLVAGIPPLLFVVRWISTHLTIAVRKQRRKEGELADYLHEAIAATPMIQSLGGSDHVVRTFARSNRRNARAGLKAKKLAARLSGTVESMLGVSVGVTLLVGAFRVGSGDLLPGELLVFLSYVRSLLKPVRSAARHAERLAKGTACGDRLLAVLDRTIEVESRPDAPPAPEDPTELVFEGVTFRYPDGTLALDAVDVRFARGELAALVGRNGAGKSTLAMLAARLADPQQGTVRLAGEDLRELQLDSVRDRVSLALQRTILLGETVRENLLVARPEATEEELVTACRAAGVDEFLDLPADLEVRLGTSGAGLSGGQQARLSLARTLLRDAPVLVVDEPFAGLDRASSALVLETLESLAAERIVIVITHDRSQLSHFDNVVYLERGHVESVGRHEELDATCPGYRDIVREVAAR